MGSTATAEIARMLGSIHDRDHYTVLLDFFEISAISIRNAVDFGRDRAEVNRLPGKAAGSGTRTAKRRTQGTSPGGR